METLATGCWSATRAAQNCLVCDLYKICAWRKVDYVYESLLQIAHERQALADEAWARVRRYRGT